MANTSSTKNKGQEGESMTDKARGVASTAVEKAKDVASSVAHTAGNVATAVGEKADSATSSVGSGMKSLGETIRDKGPQSGFLGSATSTVAGALESSGRYLEEQGLSGIGEDLTNLIRRNPLSAILLGIGLGFLLARATSSRS
jgi:hypothetical protein